MSFSKQDIEVLKQAKSEGKTKEQALAMLAQSRRGTEIPKTETKPISNRITDFLGLNKAVDVFGRTLARSGIGTETPTEVTKEFISKPTTGETAGAVAQTIAIPAGLALTGGASTAGKIVAGATAGYAYDVGQDLLDKKTTKQVVTPGVATIVGGAAPLVSRALTGATGTGKEVIGPMAEKAMRAVPDSTIVQGAKQTAVDIAERVPRFVARQQENLAEAAAKSRAIEQAPTPAVASAIKVELPEKFINTISEADEPTRAAYRRVVELADEVPKKIGVKTNPTIVGGELAAKQYDVIENQRKTIGKAIGDATKKLGKDRTIDMQPSYAQLNNILSEQGIRTIVDEKGVQLDFSRSNLAPKQREIVKQLYQLATESGRSLSPFEIHRKDQLFSALQREARADQVADILIDLPDGTGKIDLFRVFRDVYANQLDSLSPEIKDLNRKYRNVATLLDDIENSIFKTPDFNVTKTTDPAEFAKVNLRRIFGESQSSPVYEAIADEMDTISRQLGYADAKPKDVAAFAQELRELYPEITPRTGFAGGLRAGLADFAEKVMSAGEISPEDKRKALKMLLESTSSD